MDKFDILITLFVTGFGFNFALMLLMFKSLTQKIDSLEQRLEHKIDSLEQKLEHKIDSLEQKLEKKIDKLDEKVTDIDRRLCRLEGAFSAKDCCVIKDERLKQAE